MSWLGFLFFLCESDRGDVAQRAVGPDVVVLPTPIFEHYPGLGQSPELFSIQAFFAQAGIEALDVAILPRASRRDVEGPDLVLGQPFTQSTLDELAAVVTADVFRGSMLFNEACGRVTQTRPELVLVWAC